MRPRRIFGLDLLRAVAIVAVVATHTRVFLLPHFPGLSQIGFGTFGVELFFVLSGFLIGGILVNLGDTLARPRMLAAFWYRRWMRTLPNYVLFLALAGVAQLATGRRPPRLASYLFFGQNLVTPIPPFFAESWSLAVEEWFYLAFPLLLAIVLRWLRVRHAFLAVALVLLIVPPILRVVWIEGGMAQEGMREIVILRLDALMYGVLAAWFAQETPAAWRRARWPGVTLGLVLLAGLALYFAGAVPLPSEIDEALFDHVIFFCLLAFGFACLLPACSVWSASSETRSVLTVRLVARWSYAWYLIHPRVIGVLGAAARSSLASPWAAGAVCAACWIVSFGAAGVVYRCYEKPIMDLRDRWPVNKD